MAPPPLLPSPPALLHAGIPQPRLSCLSATFLAAPPPPPPARRPLALSAANEVASWLGCLMGFCGP
uniref:Uncharacterized protein n=1 Tax=Oryza nivara TaxID=4536 RepID=A0A0E0IIZ8_ORYNI